MKTNLILLCAIAALTAAVTGCINTVSGTKTAAMPFLKDRVEAKYERASDQVFNAAKNVLTRNGTITSAGSLYGMTNDIRVLAAKVNQEHIYVRVESLNPQLSDVTVQARGKRGWSDIDLAAEIDKEIALELAR